MVIIQDVEQADFDIQTDMAREVTRLSPYKGRLQAKYLNLFLKPDSMAGHLHSLSSLILCTCWSVFIISYWLTG